MCHGDAIHPRFAKRIANAVWQADWLRYRRVVAWSAVLCAMQMVLLVSAVRLSVEMHRPLPSDFVSFYAAGSLAVSGAPRLAYDPIAHYQAEQDATAAGMTYVFFFYPPIFLVLCAALAPLPYVAAFVIFQIATLTFFIAVVRRILRVSDWAWCIPLLAFPPVFWAVGLGQNAFLTAALFGLGTLLIDDRPILAGIAFGLLCYKPHFGLLVPVALFAGRRWTAFFAAAATVACATAVSVGLFSWTTWRDYLIAFSASRTVYESGRIVLGGFVTPFGAARLMGVPPDIAYAAQAAVTVIGAACVFMVWRKNANLAIRSGVLIAATLLSVPLALLYDLVLLVIPIAWLVSLAKEGRFRRWERLALIGVYVIPLLSLPLGTELRLPIGPLAAVAVLVLCLARLGDRPPVESLHAGLA